MDMTDFLLPDLLNIVIRYVGGDIDCKFNLDKVNRDFLSMNPSAIHILKKNLDTPTSHVDWTYLSQNDTFFERYFTNKLLIELDYKHFKY